MTMLLVLTVLTALAALCGAFRFRTSMKGRLKFSKLSSGASANELNISDNSKKYDDENVFVNNMEIEEHHGDDEDEIDDDEEEDELEREMALETFQTLKSDSTTTTLSISDFLLWDDIQDIMGAVEDDDRDDSSKGVIDDDTMDIILQQCGVDKEDGMAFEQFLEVVELVNQVALTLESDADVDAWNPLLEQQAVDAAMRESQGLDDMNAQDFQALLQSLGLKKNPEAAS